MRLCDGRVVVVTGAGRGIGREYAIGFARAGARVVVNDLGGEADGRGASEEPAARVVREIQTAGGEAVVNFDDVASWSGASQLVNGALSAFGRLDVLVNNAGILRDRMLVSMTEADWDEVVRVHLRGTVAPLHHAAAYWRRMAKEDATVDARVINTTSSSGLFCNPGQANYGAAKAGVAALTVIASRELERYGVTVNAVFPTALSRLTVGLMTRAGMVSDRSDADELSPRHVAALVIWLASDRSKAITGRVFGVRGSRITVAEGWQPGPEMSRVRGEWQPEELDDVVPALVARAAPNARVGGRHVADTSTVP